MTPFSKVVAFDTETWVIRPGLQAPPVVCLSYALITDGVLHHVDVVDRHEAPKYLRHWLEQPDVLLTGANVAFDFACMAEFLPLELIFEAYGQNRVTDVLTRQKLLDLAAGKYHGYVGPDGIWIPFQYNLQGVAKRHCQIELDKEEDSPRLHYQKLYDLPISEWGQRDLAYARADAQATGYAYLGQERLPAEAAYFFPGKNPLLDQFAQARAAWWLKLTSIHGIRTDKDAVLKFGKEVAQEYERVCEELFYDGLMRRTFTKNQEGVLNYIREKGLLEHFLVRPRNAPPRVTLSAEAYRTSGDELLQWLGKSQELALICRSEKPKNGSDHDIQAWTQIVRRNWAIVQRLSKAGLVTVSQSRNTKAAKERMITVCKAQGLQPKVTSKPKAKKGKATSTTWQPSVSLDAEACRRTHDPLLEQYAEQSSLSKTLSNDIPQLLMAGLQLPVHTRFEELQETGRTGSSKPNIQNVRRLKGIRECFVPRPGFVFVDADYGMLELHTLGQVCIWWLGHSSLAQALNAGLDPHVVIGAQMAGIPYDEGMRLKALGDPKFDQYRSCGKVGNFGLAGGSGAETLVAYAKKTWGVYITLEQAIEIKRTWLAQWVEMAEYQAYVRRRFSTGKLFAVVVPGSERLRAGVHYCPALNNAFQGLGADVGKRAGWYVSRECYADRTSPLYGSRIVNFPHDELIVEVPEEHAQEGAARVEYLMNQASRELLPDCPAKTKPLLARRWSKSAKRIVDDNGRLQVWDSL